MCFRCKRCFQAQCREIRVESSWIATGIAEPITVITMTGGEPDDEVLVRWEFLLTYPVCGPKVSGYGGKVMMRSVPITVRSPGCQAQYMGEPIGIRFEHGGFRSLCHECYVKLLVCGSVPSLVNLCIAELYQAFADTLDTKWKNHPKMCLLFRQKLRSKSKNRTSLVHPNLALSLVDISHRIDLQYKRFDKIEGGGNDYTAADGQQVSIPLPTLCVGSARCTTSHYTIYPSFLLQVQDWKYHGHQTARFQCVHCMSIDEELFPHAAAAINFIGSEIGYGYGPFEPLFKQQ